MDPRGSKIGGIQTHVRQLLENYPPDCRLVLIGLEGRGDCTLGELAPMKFGNRSFDFLPVARYPEDKVHAAAKTVGESLTLRFAIGLFRYFFRIRKYLAGWSTTVELQRFEFASIPFLLGFPVIQIVHGDGGKNDRMDSLLKRYWYLHRINEWIALKLAARILCVNPDIEARLRDAFPDLRDRMAFMPVSVDTNIFRTVQFEFGDDVFRVVFAGRLDEFKDPPLMMEALRKAHDRLSGALEFHYVGTSDPGRYAEFQRIKNFTVCHGYQTSSGVAAAMSHCHAGILTSYFEGMPCYLLELLAVGRLIIAVKLPQYELVVEDRVSGTLVPRISDREALAGLLADHLVSTWTAIRQDRFDANRIHGKIVDYSVETQLSAHFRNHKNLTACGGRRR